MALQDHGVPSILIIPLIQIVAGILLFIALLNGLRDLSILTILVLGFACGAWLWTRVSLWGLSCRLLIDRDKLFPGEQVTLAIAADNRKILPLWLQLAVPFRSLLYPDNGPKNLVKEGSLLWFQRTTFTWEIVAERRGVYRVGPPLILAGDLFAFFTRSMKLDEARTLLVYPRIVPIKSFPLPQRDFFGIPGAKSPVQDPVYILGTRDYQHGRPAKYIHWKASARRNRLQEKVLEPTQQEKVLIVIDVLQFSRAKAEQEFERTLEMAASLAAMLDRRGHAIGLVTNGVIEGKESSLVPIARNNQQLPAILEVLARLQMKPKQRLTDVLRRGIHISWGVSGVCFFYQDDRMLGVIREYCRHAKIPALFFVSQRSIEETGQPAGTGIVYSLDAMNIQEAARA